MNKKIMALACALMVALPAQADLTDVVNSKWSKLGWHFGTNGGEALAFYWVAKRALHAWSQESTSGNHVKALATLSDKFGPSNKVVAVGATLALANYGWTTFKAGKDIYNEVDKQVDAKDVLAAAQKLVQAAAEKTADVLKMSADELEKLAKTDDPKAPAAKQELTRRKEIEATRGGKLAADKQAKKDC